MDGLVIWSETFTRPMTKMDFRSVPRRSSGDFPFRVRNQSKDYIARSVVVDLDGAGAEQIWLSTDGARFTASIAIGDLPSDAWSPVLWLRRNTNADAALGPMESTLRARAGSWAPRGESLFAAS